MASCQEDLDKLSLAHADYEAALAKAERLKLERDAAVLAAREAGATLQAIGDAMGATRSRSAQLVERASDKDFQARLKRVREQNAEALQRLAR